MMRANHKKSRRATVLLMIVGLLAMLFMLVTAYITLARFDRVVGQQVTRGEQIEEMLGSLEDVMVSQLVHAGEASPGASIKDENYPDIPGYGPTRALGAVDPVRAPDGPVFDNAQPDDYLWLGLGSINNDATRRSVGKLARDFDRDDSQPADIDFDAVSPRDRIGNAREPWMDADGDGVADTFFGTSDSDQGGMRMLTELANAVAGNPISGAGFNPNHLPANGDVSAFDHFDENARYIGAVRVVPHGGMALVALPDDPAYDWVREFTVRMFDWVKHPEDPSLASLSPGDVLRRMDQLWADRHAIEPLLRRRGGLLVGGRASDNPAMLPPALRLLQDPIIGMFPRTFDPSVNYGGVQGPFALAGGRVEEPWQRFNLSLEREWEVWRRAVSVDAPAYIDWWRSGVGSDPRLTYAARRIITTVNNSDLLARKQNVTFPDPNADNMGITAGRPKFYLGKVAGAFDPDTLAYLADPNGTGQGQGQRIVRELADYYYEMLAEFGGFGTGSQTWPLSKRQQAFMLAVNTVAFAAPRNANGFVDNVWYQDGTKRYVGYAPQPFISQVMAYRYTDDPNDPNGDTALAIELYNPNERYDDGTGDQQALFLPQFAISLNSQFETSGTLRALTTTNVQNLPSDRMLGRSFLQVVINDGNANTYFEDHATMAGETLPVIDELIVDSPGDEIEVKLWRNGRTSGWILVDRFEIDEPDDPPGGDPNDWDWDGSWVDAWRDTSHESYWGVDEFHPRGPALARWRMAAAIPQTDPVGVSESRFKDASDDDGQPHAAMEGGGPFGFLSDRTRALGQAGPGAGDPNDPNSNFGPNTPLWLMNADRDLVEFHGSLRPASYPTVGFLHFVPRSSHVHVYDGTTSTYHPAGEYLYREWFSSGYSSRADLGHMPVFYNSSVDSGGVRDLPWGLLVYDYFTTIDYEGVGRDGLLGTADDRVPIDPLRIPGRININTAPWHVLAGLPLIGPIDGTSNNDLPFGFTMYGASNQIERTNASPAFWRASSGVLTGVGVGNSTERCSVYYLDGAARTADEVDNGEWYRLGPYFGQAVAAYRDQFNYVNNAPIPLGAAGVRPRYANGYGNLRRDNTQRPLGFLTVGELANVVGFDGADLGQGLASDDFFKAISMLALLDTQFLTTRSNTCTVYASLIDREDQQASIRSQVTIDRSNLLPRAVPVYDPADPSALPTYVTIESAGEPATIGRREVSYFNTRYDD